MQSDTFYAQAMPVKIQPGGPVPSTFAGSSGDQPNSVATASLPGVFGRRTFITGFTVCGSGATLGLGVLVTVTGINGGTMTYVYVFGVGALVGNQPLNVSFPTPIPANADNTPIVVSCPAGGLGNLHNTVVVYGYQD